MRFFNRLTGGAVALAVVSLGVIAAAGAASADIAPDCKTVTIHYTNRPDSGNHGTWATDTFARVIQVCHDTTVKPAESIAVQAWHYKAIVHDNGTFVTVGGASNSPNEGHAVHGGTPGVMVGGFTATFTAPHDWGYWNGDAFNGKTLNGPAGDTNPTTSNVVKALWTDGFEGNSINNDWKWVYRTCAKGDKCVEQWIDAYPSDGAGRRDGDITGKPCPSASASTSSTATPTGTPSLHTGSPVVQVTGSTAAGLPVTGSKTTVMAGGAAVLILAGTGLFLLARRRRVRFEA
jgi:LPXTG-motif cell wall-anchored protein